MIVYLSGKFPPSENNTIITLIQEAVGNCEYYPRMNSLIYDFAKFSMVKITTFAVYVCQTMKSAKEVQIQHS